jgi:flagellar protein FliS
VENKTQQDIQSSYQATQIATATKEQLLLITYDIGIRACQIAEGALLAKDYDVANREILRGQNVIRELMVTLNVERGGEVAENLLRLYDFMHNTLIEANIQKDVDKLNVVSSMFKELRQTWEEALMKLLEEYKAAHPEEAIALEGEEKAQANVPVRTEVRPVTHSIPTGGVNIAG